MLHERHEPPARVPEALQSLALLALFAAAASAQGRGTISGTVKDSSGAMIQRANVNLVQTGTGLTRTAGSNPEGLYVVPSLPPAEYNLQVSRRRIWIQYAEAFVHISTVAIRGCSTWL
jgi:hypothetical protein